MIKSRFGSWLFWLAVIFLIGMSGGIYYLYRQGQTGLGVERSQIDAEIQSLQRIDADWTADVLRSRTGLNQNYDAVVAPVQTFDYLERRLKSGFGAVMDDPEVAAAAGAMSKAFEDKAGLIDRFKAQDSLMKNSLRYLPTAAQELGLNIEPKGARKEAFDLAQAFNQRLLHAVSTSESSSLREAAALLKQMKTTPFLLDPENSANFLRHAETAFLQFTESDATLEKIAAIPTSEKIASLAKTSSAVFERYGAQVERTRTTLIGLTICLLALIAAMGWYIWRNYRDLELAVRQRTSQLSTALSDLKEAQAQLVQNEKMSSLGQMVAGIAHEINTPVAYVKNSLQLLRAQMQDMVDTISGTNELVLAIAQNPRDKERIRAGYFRVRNSLERVGSLEDLREVSASVDDGLHGVGRISEIVSDLKNFSRLDRAAEDLLNLNEAIDSTLNIARNVVKPFEVIKNYAEITPVRCAPSQINQVLLNLITNACQAMAAGHGRLILDTRQSGDWVECSVEDTGAGIAPEIVSKIWDPFFTTKKVGEGTGLGLSIVRKIVDAHEGVIDVSSVPGQGTRFTLRLKVAGPGAVPQL
jgi:two-component system, NtrC family, sensor kinase